MRIIRIFGLTLVGTGFFWFLVAVLLGFADHYHAMASSFLCAVGILLFHCKNRCEKAETDRRAILRFKRLQDRLGARVVRSIQIGSVSLAGCSLIFVVFFAAIDRDGMMHLLGLVVLMAGAIIGSIFSPPKTNSQQIAGGNE